MKRQSLLTHFWSSRPHKESNYSVRIWLYTAIIVLSAFLLSDISIEESFAQPADTAPAFVQNSFHRGISDSLSLASTFGSPGTPSHYARVMSENVSISSTLPGQSQHVRVADSGNAFRTAASYLPSSVQRFDERYSLSKLLNKKTENFASSAMDGPTGFVDYVAVLQEGSSDNFIESGEGSSQDADPDDNSSSWFRLVYSSTHVSVKNNGSDIAVGNSFAFTALLTGTLGITLAWIESCSSKPILANKKQGESRK